MSNLHEFFLQAPSGDPPFNFTYRLNGGMTTAFTPPSPTGLGGSVNSYRFVSGGLQYVYTGGTVEYAQFGKEVTFATGDCIRIENANTTTATPNCQIGTSVTADQNIAIPLSGVRWISVVNPFTNSVFSEQECCVHPDTLVETPTGLVQIKDIGAGDLVIDMNGDPIRVVYNIKYIPSNEFVKISEGSLGNGAPNMDLYIRREHPVLYEGKEVSCTDLLNGNSIRDVILPEEVHVWSLCTNKRTFVKMQGIPVCTWSQVAWENFTKNDSAGKGMVFWTQ